MEELAIIEARKLEYILKTIPKSKKSIDFFKELDEQYKINAKNNRGVYDTTIFSPKHIINKKWIGLWLKATGIDMDLYINWLYAGLTIKEYKEKTIEYWYKEAHPKEKYIPYSISKANEDLHNYI